VIVAVLISCLNADASKVNLLKMKATAYCIQGTTSTGIKTRKGICATGNSEWVGKTVVIYQRLPNEKVGDIIGIYEIEDTGCKPDVIDVWYPTLDECQGFMNRVYEDGCKGKIYVQILDAEG